MLKFSSSVTQLKTCGFQLR